MIVEVSEAVWWSTWWHLVVGRCGVKVTMGVEERKGK